MRLSMVIPCNNETKTIRSIVDAVRAAPTCDLGKEITIGDDRSINGTRELLRTEIAPLVARIVYHERNQGKGAALRTGFAAATDDLVVIQDSDLEYAPKEYPRLLNPLLKGKADVVFSSRFAGSDRHRVAKPEFVSCESARRFPSWEADWAAWRIARQRRARSACSAEHPLPGRRRICENTGTMFLRRKDKQVHGVGYSYWSLCETVRTARGPRQRVVASLGKLEKAQLPGGCGWADLTALLRGEELTVPAPQPPLPGFAPAESAAQWEQADVQGLRVERARDFGEPYLALGHRLGLDRLLAELLPAERESVQWAQVAALPTVTRFCAQRSELGRPSTGTALAACRTSPTHC